MNRMVEFSKSLKAYQGTLVQRKKYEECPESSFARPDLYLPLNNFIIVFLNHD